MARLAVQKSLLRPFSVPNLSKGLRGVIKGGEVTFRCSDTVEHGVVLFFGGRQCADGRNHSVSSIPALLQHITLLMHNGCSYP